MKRAFPKDTSSQSVRYSTTELTTPCVSALLALVSNIAETSIESDFLNIDFIFVNFPNLKSLSSCKAWRAQRPGHE